MDVHRKASPLHGQPGIFVLVDVHYEVPAHWYGCLHRRARAVKDSAGLPSSHGRRCSRCFGAGLESELTCSATGCDDGHSDGACFHSMIHCHRDRFASLLVPYVLRTVPTQKCPTDFSRGLGPRFNKHEPNITPKGSRNNYKRYRSLVYAKEVWHERFRINGMKAYVMRRVTEQYAECRRS